VNVQAGGIGLGKCELEGCAQGELKGLFEFDVKAFKNWPGCVFQ
jgi:hypothetical protein